MPYCAKRLWLATATIGLQQKGIRGVRVCHGTTTVFDDPNLVSWAGLVPVLELAGRAGLNELVRERVHLPGPSGAAAECKVGSIVAGMVAGADSIEDMRLLRHGALPRLLSGSRAPSTLGTFLRTFTFGHVRQLDASASRLLINLSRCAPLLPASDGLVYVDVDDTVRQTYGYAKQGAGRGYTGVKGLNVLLATVSSASSAPVIAAARLRKGSTASPRGAHRLVADALGTTASMRPDATRVLRADSAFYARDIISACIRHDTRFSITARQDPAVRKTIAAIGEDAWVPIKYTNAVWDETAQAWISDAEVAETTYTAFSSRGKAEQVTARLIVRRVPDANPAHQNPLFTVYRHHAVLTNSPLTMLEAEKAHRAHAIVEQVIADLKNGPLAHLPSGHFGANSAWLVCAAIAFNLTRAAGVLASILHAKATTGTIRAQLIAVPARLSRSARKLTLHLPKAWPWTTAWTSLATGARHGPQPA
jgi:hypothetical protein